MSLPRPPRYVVLPEEVIEQSYKPDKPRRALLASFTRILSLAWESKYERTPPLHEEELMAFLKLSRRQYFEQKADMELLGWLRSSHPRPGFVQFSFSRSIVEKVSLEPGAENRTELPSVVEILSHTDVLFDGSVVVSKGLEHCIPREVLAWCAYAYYQFKRQRLDRPAGLVRRRLLDGETASERMRAGWQQILPDAFLESVRLLTYDCPVVGCGQIFAQRATLDEHKKADHPLPHLCEVCQNQFTTRELLQIHLEEAHKKDEAVSVETVEADPSVRVPIDGDASFNVNTTNDLKILERRSHGPLPKE